VLVIVEPTVIADLESTRIQLLVAPVVDANKTTDVKKPVPAE
jgi:hypothetical protein